MQSTKVDMTRVLILYFHAITLGLKLGSSDKEIHSKMSMALRCSRLEAVAQMYKTKNVMEGPTNRQTDGIT